MPPRGRGKRKNGTTKKAVEDLDDSADELLASDLELKEKF